MEQTPHQTEDWARVQIRGPHSVFTIKRRNNTYDITHFSYFDSTFLAAMLKIQIVATDIDINSGVCLGI